MTNNHAVLRKAVRDALYEAIYFQMDMASADDIPGRLNFEIGVPILPATEGVPEYMIAVAAQFDFKVVPRHQKSGQIADMVRSMRERGDA